MLTDRDANDAPLHAGAGAHAPEGVDSALITGCAQNVNSDMDISDDDRAPPSNPGSYSPTHPPPHQGAHEFLSRLFEDLGDRGPVDGTVATAGDASVTPPLRMDEQQGGGPLPWRWDK